MIKDYMYIKQIAQKLYRNNVNLAEILIIIFFLVFFFNYSLYEVLNFNIEEKNLYFNNEIVLNISKKLLKNDNKICQSIKSNSENKHSENFILSSYVYIDYVYIFCILHSVIILKECFINLIYCIMYIYNKSRKKIKICGNKLRKLCLN